MKLFFLTGVLSLLVSYSSNASAQSGAQTKEKWEIELETYSKKVESYGETRLFLAAAKHSGLMVGTCSASATIVAATALADTYPILGFVAEGLANLSDDNYLTLDAQAFFSLETLANTGRGTAGGALVGVAESFEFVFQWLSGSENASYQALKKVYASTVKTGNSLFSEKSKCVTSFSKLAIVLNEVNYRSMQKPSPLLSDIIMP